jgi:hypothetical protein
VSLNKCDANIATYFLIYLVADATLFEFILVSYSTIGLRVHRHTLFFAWGFALWMYLQDDWKLACRGAELL